MKAVSFFVLLIFAFASANLVNVTTGNWSSSFTAVKAGDTLLLAAGSYPARSMDTTKDGTLQDPIVIKGVDKNKVIINSSGEGIVFYNKHWIWEGIHFKGTGSNFHLFHIKPRSRGYLTVRGCHFSGVADKAFKIDLDIDSTGFKGIWPDYILVENCTMQKGHAGLMNNDGSDFLTCRGNYTYGQTFSSNPDSVTVGYDYFTKGGQAYTIFENNIAVGGTIGAFSFGGGTMGGNFPKFRHDDDMGGAAAINPSTNQPYGYKAVEVYRSICRNNIIIDATGGIAIQANIDCEYYNNTLINCVNTINKEFAHGAATNFKFYNNLTIKGADDPFIQFDGYAQDGVIIQENDIALGDMPLTDIFMDFKESDTLGSNYRLKPSIYSQIGAGRNAYDHPDWPAFYAVTAGSFDFYGAPRPNPPTVGATEVNGVAVEYAPDYGAGTDVSLEVTPNPANPSTQLFLTLRKDQPLVDILIYDVRGKHVRTLYYGPMSKGRQIVCWDGRNHDMKLMASGSYIFRVSLGRELLYKKFQLVR